MPIEGLGRGWAHAMFSGGAQLLRFKERTRIVWGLKGRLSLNMVGRGLFVLWEGASLMLRMGRLLKIWGWGLTLFGGGAKVI